MISPPFSGQAGVSSKLGPGSPNYHVLSYRNHAAQLAGSCSLACDHGDVFCWEYSPHCPLHDWAFHMINFGHNSLNSHSFHAHNQTNCWSNWAQILWANFLLTLRWISAIPGLWLIQMFSPICRYTADRIELKLGRPTRYWPFQVWVTFGHAPRNSRCFLDAYLLSVFCAFADKLLIRFSSNLVSKLMMDLF